MKNVLQIVFFYVCHSIPLCAGDTLYVHSGAMGLPADGTSWGQAFRALEAALSTAQTGDQIWVAEGTYIPEGTDRDTRFDIPAGVALYGGFAGWESTIDERIHGTFLTVLSGDIGTAGDHSDNCYTIVYFKDPDAGNILDGFALRYGNAGYPNPFEPYMSERRNGGAVYATSSKADAKLIIRNCLFEHNVALYSGGAVCIWSSVGIAPLIMDCIFLQNMSGTSGGGLSMLAGMATRGVCVTGCVFRENASVFGGGFELHNSRSDSIVITGCLFEENAGVIGSGLRVRSPTVHVETLEVSESDFMYNINEGNGTGGALDISSNNFNTGYEKVLVRNCEFIRQRITSGSTSGYGLKCSRSRRVRVDGALFESDAIGLGGSGPNSVELFEMMNSKVYDVHGTEFMDVENHASSSKTVILNSQIFDNSGSMRFQSQLSIINSVIAFNNRYPSQIGGLISTGTLNIYNSIYWGNTYNALGANTVTCSHVITDLTHFDSLFRSEADIELDAIQYQTDPLFVDFLSRDFRLRSCSPAVNAGSNAIIFSEGIERDFDGNPRIVDGIVDIGAYEHHSPFRLSVQDVHSVRCHGDADGSIGLEIGGTEPLDFSWESDGTTGTTTTGLAPGGYRLRLSDGDMCIDSIDVTIAEPDPLILNTEVDQITCFGEHSGSAQVHVVGGTEPYTITWSTGASGNIMDGAGAGSYSVTVSDAQLCTESHHVVIEQPAPLTMEYHVTHPASEISFDGSIVLGQVQGGVPPYQVAWQDGSTFLSRDQLPPGHYILHVTDHEGCLVVFDIILEARTLLDAEVVITIWPNPINRTRTLKVEVISGISFMLERKVFDALGREMAAFAQTENILPGVQVFEYPFDLPYAMYFIRFTDQGRDLGLYKVAVVSD